MSVVVLGSRGRMGSMFMRRFAEAGLAVRGLDQPLQNMAEELAGADVLLLCVPAAVLRQALRRALPHLPAEAVLADITSVKVRPMENMESLWPGAVVGTHPLFGPESAPGADLAVAVTPGERAAERHTVMVEDLFIAIGCRVFRTTPQRHDEAMAAVQGLNFISSLAYFATLAQREELLPFLTPSFRRRQEAARKLLTEDAPLFEGLFEANPYSHEMVRQYRSFLNMAAAGEISLLAERAAWWWKGEG